MRDIDFIPEVVAELVLKMPRIGQRFNEENEAFKKLLAFGKYQRYGECLLLAESGPLRTSASDPKRSFNVSLAARDVLARVRVSRTLDRTSRNHVRLSAQR